MDEAYLAADNKELMDSSPELPGEAVVTLTPKEEEKPAPAVAPLPAPSDQEPSSSKKRKLAALTLLA